MARLAQVVVESPEEGPLIDAVHGDVFGQTFNHAFTITKLKA
ncbi:hypothetical protein COLO4_37274 [Corchorus olitorius]|uniref:Uncharacterized protein n=1 Tax=Corchorus olitorius TaxID=93759 RepID=A0A1R3G2K3_9ROSI|nr:hypothetical protein COLO4_37274 [Corchorus olitorius]